MAVRATTSNPQNLLAEIRKYIDERKIETWQYDKDGDFTHTPEQWRFKAWFRPRIVGQEIVFYILTPKTNNMSKVVYGVYHGRFIEMLLTHFDVKMSNLVATPLPITGEVVSAPKA